MLLQSRLEDGLQPTIQPRCSSRPDHTLSRIYLQHTKLLQSNDPAVSTLIQANMSDDRESSKPMRSRNHTIARDLENLPVELIEEVIKGTHFEQIIRLSSWAGPRLKHALTSSPTWSHFFGNAEDWNFWQRCLRLTDKMNVVFFDTKYETRPLFNLGYCYRQSYGMSPRKPCHRDHGGELSFLQYPGQDAPMPEPCQILRGRRSIRVCSAANIRRQWLKALTEEINIVSSYQTPQERFEIYLPAEDLGRLKQIQAGLPKFKHQDRVLTIDELETSVVLYQRAIIERTKRLVEELRRLANLYEAHPQLVKAPFASQSPRSNVRHIPHQLRSRAWKLEKVEPSVCTRADCRSYFQNTFTALVPYDWTLRFMVTLIDQGKLRVDGKCQFVLDGMAYYFPRDAENGHSLCEVRTEGTPWSSSDTWGRPARFLAGTGKPIRGNAVPHSAHHNIELTWLETFVELVAHLVHSFPVAAEAAAQVTEDSNEEAQSDVLAEQLAGKMAFS